MTRDEWESICQGAFYSFYLILDNKPMVGATVAVAVAVEKASK